MKLNNIKYLTSLFAILMLSGCYAKVVNRVDRYSINIDSTSNRKIDMCINGRDLYVLSENQLDTLNKIGVKKEVIALKEMDYVSFPMSAVNGPEGIFLAFLTFIFLAPVYVLSAPIALYEVNNSPSIKVVDIEMSDFKECNCTRGACSGIIDWNQNIYSVQDEINEDNPQVKLIKANKPSF